MEKKSFKAVITDITDRTVTGIASVFGVIDSYNDIVVKGAFKKTIKESFNRIKFLWQHDWREPPIAAIDEMKEVPRGSLPEKTKSQFPEATGGLQIKRTYLTTLRAEEVLIGIKAKTIDEMSFAFDTIKHDFEKDEKTGALIRYLREVKAWDFSDVVWGANPATVAEKSYIPFKETPKADVDQHWDLVNERGLSTIEEIDIIGAYKCDGEGFCCMGIHHHVSEEYSYPVNIKGVKEAMYELTFNSGLCGEQHILAFNHLAEHYKQFDLEPPNFDTLELAYRAKKLMTKSGDEVAFMPLIKSAERQIAAEPVVVIQSLTDMDRKRAIDAQAALMNI